MPLSISYSKPSDSVFYYADGAVLSDTWGSVPLIKKQELYEAILSKIPKDTPFNILDIGCGNGGLALQLAQANNMPNFVYTGIDVSPKAIQTAKNHGLDPNQYKFEVQNVYEYISQKPCDWDYLVSSMFLYGHDAETLLALREEFFNMALKGVIISAGAEYQSSLANVTNNITPVAGVTNSTNMVVAFRELPQNHKVPSFNIPLRARIVENGSLNYALAELSYKNNNVWPNNVQGVTPQKQNLKKVGSIAAPNLSPIAVPQKQV